VVLGYYVLCANDSDMQLWMAVCIVSQMPTIQVFLMDGSSQQLSLVSKASTTIQQLHNQMMKVHAHSFYYC